MFKKLFLVLFVLSAQLYASDYKYDLDALTLKSGIYLASQARITDLQSLIAAKKGFFDEVACDGAVVGQIYEFCYELDDCNCQIPLFGNIFFSRLMIGGMCNNEQFLEKLNNYMDKKLNSMSSYEINKTVQLVAAYQHICFIVMKQYPNLSGQQDLDEIMSIVYNSDLDQDVDLYYAFSVFEHQLDQIRRQFGICI